MIWAFHCPMGFLCCASTPTNTLEKYSRRLFITEQVGHGPSHFMESNGMNQIWWEHEGDCKFSPFREAGIVTKLEATKEASRPSLWNSKKAMKVGERRGTSKFWLGLQVKTTVFCPGTPRWNIGLGLGYQLEYCISWDVKKSKVHFIFGKLLSILS